MFNSIFEAFFDMHLPGGYMMVKFSYPFGTLTSPVIQSFINVSVSGLPDLVYISYLDGLLCHYKTFYEYLRNLGMVLRRLKQHGVKLRAEQCLFLKNKVKYLGKIISEEGYNDD